ncbi:MAG: Phage portal protein [Acidobacteria bacterium ADurb.Bin051]|nr:MAG: Phage portal protein [Acidobacteria bacterium ADurb.Bin051]
MILRDLVEARGGVLPGAAPANAPGWLVDLFGGGRRTGAGVDVSEESALTFSAVYGCVRILAESAASLPLKVYRRAGARGKATARQHWAWSLLHDAPNPEMTAVVWRELGMVHVLTWGNAYSRIEWAGDGSARAVWPIHPSRVTVKRSAGGSVFYEVRPDPATDPPGGHPAILEPADVLHVPALGWNGLVGLSPVRLAREAVGLGQAAEAFGSGFFGRGARPGGVLSVNQALDPKARAKIAEAWEAAHQGVERAGRVAVLGLGASFTATTIPPEDAQFLETRRFQVSEVARIFRVPPHMLADLERATFSNIEHLGLEFVMHSLRPWLVRWEQEINRKLFGTSGTAGLYAEHAVDGLLRGDQASRFAAYAVGRQWGWLSADDVRELENLAPLPDGAGAVYLTPLNMVPVVGRAWSPAQVTPTEAEPEPTPEPAPDAGPEVNARAELRRACGAMVRAVYARFARREQKALARLAAKARVSRTGAEGFRAAVDAFYQEAELVLETELRQLAEAFGKAWDGEPAREASEYVGASLAQLEALLEGAGEPFGAIEARAEEWTRTRPDVAARRFGEEVGR